MIAKPVFYDQFKLDKALDCFCTSNSPVILRTVAAGFHEIVLLLKNTAYRYLKDPLAKLMATKDGPTIRALLSHIDIILRNFCMDDASRLGVEAIYTALIGLEKGAAESGPAGPAGWRLHQALIRSLRDFPDYIDSELVYEQTVHVLLKRLGECLPIPLKIEIIEVLTIYTKKLKRMEYRDTLLRQLIGIPI